MYKSILVPISFDETRQIEGALEAARTLASPDAKITLLHVMEQAPGYAISYLPVDYVAQSKAAVQEELETLAKRLPGAEPLVVSGHPGRTILDHASEAGNDLIIVASHRPGMQDLLLGSTATYIVRHAASAVHVLR